MRASSELVSINENRSDIFNRFVSSISGNHADCGYLLLGVFVCRASDKNRFPSYMVEGENRIDIQTEFQCSAFASAYVLRHFGIDARGIKLYAKIPHKMKNGYVYPKGIKATHIIAKLQMWNFYNCGIRQ